MKDLSQLDLFSIKSDLKILKIFRNDVVKETDKLKMVKNLISKHEQMYPNIEQWLKLKVLPGIKTKERVGYIGFNNEEPIVSAVLKRGKYSKFCHLHIDKKFQNNNFGDLFFAMMALDIRNSAVEAHFTLPESLWFEKKSFFQSFGFQRAVK